MNTALAMADDGDRGGKRPDSRAGGGLAISSVDDLERIAGMMFRGGCTPPNIDNPAKVAMVIMAGMDVGLSPTQAIGSIMLTNGRLTIYGDGAMGLVRASHQLEFIDEQVSGQGDDRKGTCRIKRKGEQERVYEFSMGDAKRAGLIERAKGKDGKGTGPWVSYPDRMLIARARGFAFRDVFPDVLRGLTTHEEASDLDEPPRVVQTETVAMPAARTVTPPPAPALPPGPRAVTQDQIDEFVRLRALVYATLPASATNDERVARWKERLQPFGVASVGNLTAEQAAALIPELGKTIDPFTYPASVPDTAESVTNLDIGPPHSTQS